MPLFLSVIFFIFLILMGLTVWRLRDRFEILREFMDFLEERKLWWIMPMILVFLAAGIFVLVLAKSGIATFVYVLH